MNSKLSILLAVSCLFAASAALAVDATPAGEKLVISRCVNCHNTARICQHLGKRGEAEWKKTIERMVTNGADAERDEVAVMAAYLGGLPAGAAPVCPK